MPTYTPPSQTTTLNTIEIATLKDALMQEDIPQGFRNCLLLQLFYGKAKEPGLGKQGQNIRLPGGVRPMRKTQGGTRATAPVNFEVGVTGQAFSGLQVLNTSLAEGPTETWTDWSWYTCYVARSLTEALKNTGPGKRLDTLRSRQNQEIRQLSRVMEVDLWSTNADATEGSQDEFAGVQHKIKTDPTTSTVVQGLNQSTFTPWRPTYRTSTGSWASGGIDALRSDILAISGVNGMEYPHLITTTTTVAGYIFKSLEGIHRIVGSLDNADLSATRLPTFMGIPIIYTDDNPSGNIYVWNFDYLINLVHEGADWSEHKPGNPNDQLLVDQMRWVFGAAPMMLTRRERFAVLAGVTA